MSRSRIAASFFLSFLLFAAPALAQSIAASKDSFKDACKAGYTYMIVPTASGVSVREAQRVDCTAKDATGALVNRATRECSQNIGDIYWDCRKGLTEGTYKCEHKTCKNGEAISNPATNSSPSPLSPSSQMQLPDVLIQEQGTTALPPLSRQSILDALQQAPSNTGQDSVYRSTAADSFERFMLQAGLAPGGFVPGTGNLDAGTPLSQTPNAGDAARLQGGTLEGVSAMQVETSGERGGIPGSNTFTPTQVAQFSPERPVTWEERVSTFLGCTVGYLFGGCDSATAGTNKTDAQVIAEARGRAQQEITIVAVTPNVSGGKETQLSEGEIQSRIAKDLTPDYDKLPPASQAIATKNAIDQYNSLTPESQATMRSMAIQGIQFDRAMAQSKNTAAQPQSPAAPPLPSPLDAAIAVGKSVTVTTAKSVWNWGTGAVSGWFGSTDTQLPAAGGEKPNPPAAVQPSPEPGAPAPVTPSLADMDTKTPAQLKAIQDQLSADKSAQLQTNEAKAAPRTPNGLRVLGEALGVLGGKGTEDLKVAWKDYVTALDDNSRANPTTPVQVAELSPIPGTEQRTEPTPVLAQPGTEPELEVRQPAAPPPPFTVDPKVDAQVRQAFEAQKQSAQSQIRYFEDLLGRSGTIASEAAAQTGLDISKARLDAIASEEKSYNDRTPSPALRSAVENLQIGGSEGAWARSFTSFADAAHKVAAETGKETLIFYNNPAEAIGGLADQAIVLGSGFAGGVATGLRNFATMYEVPGFEDDPNRALVNAIDPYKKYTQTAVDAANVVPFTYGIYSAGKLGFGAVVDMMSPAGTVVRDLGVIGELSTPGLRVAGTDLVESGAGAGAGTRAVVSDVPLGAAVTETSVPRLPSAVNIEPAGVAPVSPFDKVTQFVRDVTQGPAEAPTPKLPGAANIEPAGGTPVPGPYAAFDNAIADARSAAAQQPGPSGASSVGEAQSAIIPPSNSINVTLQSSPTEAGARVLITDLQPLSRGGQAEIYTANISETEAAGGTSQSMVVKQFDQSVSAGEITRTSTVYNTLVDQGFGGVVPKEYLVDPANKIAVMTNLNTDGRVALSSNNLSHELLSPRSLASVPANLDEVARSMTQNAVALGQRGIEVNYDAYLLAIDPAASRAAGFSITDFSSVKDYGQLQGYLRGSVEYNVKEVQAALDQFGTSWAADQGVRDAFQSQAGGAVRDAFAGATADQSFVDRALVGFGWKDPMAPPEVLSAAETSSAAVSAAEDAAKSVLRADPWAAPALGQEVDKLSIKSWTGGAGATAGILCLGFCPASEPLPQEAVAAEIVPLSKQDLALLFPQLDKARQPSAPSEASMPVNIVIDETPVLAQPSGAPTVQREASLPVERPVASPVSPAVIPPVLTAPPLPVESDIVVPPAQAEDAEAKVLAQMEIQRKKNEEALTAWDEAQRQRTKEIQDKIAQLEKEIVEMNLPAPVIVPQDTPQNTSPGAQGVGPLSSDEIARGLLPNPSSEGSKRKDLEINFELGSARLTNDGRDQVAALAQVMSRDEFRNSTFTIVGHTDTVGTAESNLILSRGRAQAIVDILHRNYGIPLDQLKATGAGQWVLKVPILGNVPANRRVEIVVTPRR